MNHLYSTPLAAMLGERLITAREAAVSLNLPMYWLTHACERERLKLPHYRVGKLLRFRLDELVAWAEARQAIINQAAGEEGIDAGL